MEKMLVVLFIGMIMGSAVTLMIIGLLFVSHEVELFISGCGKITDGFSEELKARRASEETDGKVAR
ncbi:MAG: hypothetical protein WCY54_09025 [Syntrophales bacterium]